MGLGWLLEPADLPPGWSPARILAAASQAAAVLAVRPGVRVPKRPRRVIVAHEATPLPAPGVDLADTVAVATGAEVLLVHVLPSGAGPEGRPKPPGTLEPPRFVDHGHHDWLAWRREFERRFCHLSRGVKATVVLETGSPARAILQATRHYLGDLLILTWKRQAAPGRARVVRKILREAPCPVLLIGEETEPGETESTWEAGGGLLLSAGSQGGCWP